MQTEWITINEVPTKILSWGRTVKEVNEDVIEDNLNYIICIPGNPGLVDVYKEFLEELYRNTDSIVWIIGHAGHNTTSSIVMPPFEENKELYGLQGQIQHKISFMEEFVPKTAKITLIGHSVGAYIILKLLRIPSIKSRIVKSYLLFPTIEYMAESTNGKLFMRFIRHILFIILFLSWIFSLLPLFIQNSLSSIYLKLAKMPSHYVGDITNFLQPFTVNNSASMALEEMFQIRERDNLVLRENVTKIKLYYAVSDGWCPISYCYDIKRDIANIDAEICDKGFRHAFVLWDSIPMAHLIAEWIMET